MTNETAALEQRRSYLTRELEVWSARQRKAETCESLRVLYWDHDFNAALGAMRGELARINTQLGTSSPARRKGTRRVNPNKSN